MKAVEALMHFQKDLPEDKRTNLTFVRVKLQERAELEKASRSTGDKATASDRSVRKGDEATASAVSPKEVDADDVSPEVDQTQEELVGKINPREPEMIQELRRGLRLTGRAWNTEIAYVKWVRRFMKSRGVVHGCTEGKCSDVSVQGLSRVSSVVMKPRIGPD